MKQEAAVRLAQEALVFIAADDERAGPFLAQTGTDPSTIRARSGDPEFLAAVLDFLLMADEAVLAFAQHSDRRPEDVLSARAALPGGDVPNWT